MSSSYYEEISADECRRLMASRGVVRIGFTRSDGAILVLPVACVVDADGILVFTTSRSSALSTLAHDGDLVTVQCDDISEDLRDGWSVLGHGRATAYEGEATPKAWVAGHDELRIGVEFERLTGRVVSAV